MKKFKIEVTLRNGITDITNCPMDYKNAEEFYEEFRNIRKRCKYIKFKIDDYIVEYKFDDISLIKIYEIE